VLTLVGDFKQEEALAKIKKYFEDIPKQPTPPVPDLTEKPQAGERRKTIEDSFAQLARVDVLFRIPPGNTDDWYAASVLASVLGGGQSSRLYQSLVKDKELAIQTVSFAQEHRGPGLLDVIALVRPGKDPKDVENAIYAEIERLKTEPIADWELDKVRMATRRQSAQQLQSTLSRAILIGQMTVYYNDPNLINTHFVKIQNVTKADVQRVAKKFLTDDNRTVITTVPKPKTMMPPKPAAQ